MFSRTYILGLLLAALAGAGIVLVAHSDLYEHPEVVFGLVDIFS